MMVLKSHGLPVTTSVYEYDVVNDMVLNGHVRMMVVNMYNINNMVGANHLKQDGRVLDGTLI